MDNQKQWWAPVWRGLVVDQEAKHYRRMRNGIWLFLYFLLHANRKEGLLLRKIQTVSRDMGLRRDMILRWLAILKRNGYISTKNTGRCLSIHIKKWKSLPEVGNMSHQECQISNFRGWKNPTSQKVPEDQNPFMPSQKLKASFFPNDITIKKDLLNNDIDKIKKFESDFNVSKGFKPQNRKERLSLDLAEALNDQDALLLYLSYANKYPESLLRKVLGEVREIPDGKIKKSRGALFNHLIQLYAKKANQNLSH